MYKLLIACMMIVSFKTARVLEKQEVSCKVSIAQEDAQKPDSNFKVSVNCEDLNTKKKMTQNLSCKNTDKLQVFRVDKAAVQQAEAKKQVKTDTGDKTPVQTPTQDQVDKLNQSQVIDSKIQEDRPQVNLQTPQSQTLNDSALSNSEPVVQNNNQPVVQDNNQPQTKKRILAEDAPKQLVNSYDLAVGEQQFNLDNYSLQSIDKLDGCQVLVKGSLINSALKVLAVFVLALF